MKCTLMHKRIAVAEMELDDATGFIQKIGRPAGCLKVNEAAAQTETGDPRSLEVERIYVAKEFQGTGSQNEVLMIFGIMMECDFPIKKGKFILTEMKDCNTFVLQRR